LNIGKSFAELNERKMQKKMPLETVQDWSMGPKFTHSKNHKRLT